MSRNRRRRRLRALVVSPGERCSPLVSVATDRMDSFVQITHQPPGASLCQKTAVPHHPPPGRVGLSGPERGPLNHSN